MTPKQRLAFAVIEYFKVDYSEAYRIVTFMEHQVKLILAEDIEEEDLD